MYIEKVFIRNFRSIGEIGVSLSCNKGINLILGENNAGKSAVIDALRLVLSVGNYKKGIYAKTTDFHINKYGVQKDKINIDIYFNELTEEQATAFFMLTNGTNLKKAELHVEYSLYIDKKGSFKVREDVKGGPALNTIHGEVYDNINLLYLAALRDAENDLKPSKVGQLANMLSSVARTTEDRERIIQAFQKANETLMGDVSIQSMEDIINKNLLNIEKDELQEKVKVSVVEPTFESIASLIRIDYKNSRLMCMTVEDMKAVLKELGLEAKDVKGKTFFRRIPGERSLEIDLDILSKDTELSALYNKLLTMRSNQSSSLNQNGLGYNNILHMASSLGDLQEKPLEEEYSILLVEEPEAHLHPQLLDLLFDFFKKANENSNIQLFITSHSPTLAAKADINSLHILNSKEGISKFTSIKDTVLDENEKLDLKRYLDVTKSQLFFARRIIFVEGISEAILITEFAKLIGRPLDKYSVEIVNINGVAFHPFAKLFQKNDIKDYLNIPCVIISDNDKCTNNEDLYQIKKEERIYKNIDTLGLLNKLSNGDISHRAKLLLEYSKDNICVQLAEKTLEYELAKIEDNVKLLLEVLEKEHPTIANDIREKNNVRIKGIEDENPETLDQIALRIWVAIQDCKGTFAQRLASELSKIISGARNDISFKVPQYICDAIDFILK